MGMTKAVKVVQICTDSKYNNIMPYTVSKNMFSNMKMDLQTQKTSENYAYLHFNYPISVQICKETGS